MSRVFGKTTKRQLLNPEYKTKLPNGTQTVKLIKGSSEILVERFNMNKYSSVGSVTERMRILKDKKPRKRIAELEKKLQKGDVQKGGV